MKAAHTPGPWKVHIDDNAIWVEPPNNAESVICDLCGRDADVLTDEDEANANLIAASPDMLKALDAARQELLGASSYLATCDPATVVKNLDSLVASLKNKLAIVEPAICKARGIA